MFTGIIQNIGIVTARRESGRQVQFSFRFKRKEKRPLVSGESIAVNGVCLTARECKTNLFKADVIRETLDSTTLGRLRKGDRVNLERSLRFGDSLGGHFVTGHVDGLGKIVQIKKSGRNQTFSIQAPSEVLKFIAAKGSVTVDGTSLIVQKIRENVFEIGLVPHTLKETTLSDKKAGDGVNLEADLIARYLHLFSDIPKFRNGSSKNLRSKLKQQGF